MLEARGIDASDGKLTADVAGSVAKEEGVLSSRAIHVKYRLEAGPADREAIRRAHDAHADRCPVYRTLRGCVDITTELAVAPQDEPAGNLPS